VERDGHSDMISRCLPTTNSIVGLMETFEKEQDSNQLFKLPYRMLSKMVGGGFKRGMLSIIAGPPGNGKSYMAYKFLLWFMEQQYKTLYLPLENKHEESMRRIMASYVNSWGMVNADGQYAQQRKEAFTNSQEMVDMYHKVEGCVCQNPSRLMFNDKGEAYIPSIPFSEMLECLKVFCDRADIVIIDPITKLDCDLTGGKKHEQEEKFVKGLKAIAESTDTHIMMIGHTNKRSKYNGKEANLAIDDIAGSVAWNRFCQYIFLLDYHEEKTSEVTVGIGMKKEVQHKRSLLVSKCNEGSGKGQKLAYDFVSGPDMQELGWVRYDDN
jgi:hypothetical protein